MPKISYKFTIPQDSYNDFRTDILQIASGINFEGIEFNDTEKTALFSCDAFDLSRLFQEELQSKGKNEKYQFFYRSPENFTDCERRENEENISFIDAWKKEFAVYEDLKTITKEKISLPEHRMVEELTQGKSLVISEYHSDPYPKTKLMELLKALSDQERKPVLVLERASSSRDETLQKWLIDGSSDSEIPLSIKKYCDFIDKQNLGGIWPSATEAEKEILKNGYSNILRCAKQNSFDVVFMESEHSTFASPEGRSDTLTNNRHRNLVSSMQHIKEENEGRNFIVFCGAYHDERSEDAEVILSDVVNAFSCELFSRDLPDKLHETAEFYRNAEKNDMAKLYEDFSKKYYDQMRPTDLVKSGSNEKLSENPLNRGK